MAESVSGDRKRSTTLVIALSAVVVIVGLFAAGFVVGGATTGPSATSTTTTTTSTTKPAVACTSTPSGCLGITSSPTDTVVVGSPFSFNVLTMGAPVTRMEKVGRLPRGVHFQNNHNGTGTLAGTPRKSAVGTYHLTWAVRFGRGKAKDVIRQAFTLNVVAASS